MKITLKVEKGVAFPTTDHDADELKKCEGGKLDYEHLMRDGR